MLADTVTVARPRGPGTLPTTSRPTADVLLLIDGSSTSATLRQSASTLFPAILSALANATSALRVGVAKFVDLPSTGTGALPYVLLLVLFGGIRMVALAPATHASRKWFHKSFVLFGVVVPLLLAEVWKGLKFVTVSA